MQNVISSQSIITKKAHEKQSKVETTEVDKIDKAYSTEPWYYDLRGLFILTFSYRSTLPEQIRLFAGNMGPQHLEVALGTGTLLELVVRWRKLTGKPVSAITGFDYAERMLAGARKRFKTNNNVKLVRADAAKLQFADSAFDTVNIANAIHCLPEVQKSLQETFRVLKGGGILAGNCLLEPAGTGFFCSLARRINTWGMKKGILVKPYSANEITNLLIQAGFKTLSLETSGNCLNFKVQKPVV